MTLPVRISAKFEKLVVPAVGQVAGVFGQLPDIKRLQVEGVEHLVIDHNVEATIILRNLGYTLPPPSVHYKYPGDKTPFKVQENTVEHLVMNKRAYVLNDMGTGKTASTLWAWDYLYTKGLTGKMIVFAPLSTLTVVWMAEIFRTLPHRRCAVLYGSRAKREAYLDDRDVDIYIINHDGHKIIHDTLLKRPDINHITIDELAVYRNAGSARSKLMTQYAKLKERVWGLTGSPMPNSPTDVFSQAKIVTPSTVPQYFRTFRDKLMEKYGTFKYVPKKDAVEQAYAVLQPAVRYHLNDVVELPEVVEQFMDVPMGTKQAQVYNTLAKAAFAMVESGETITAANAGGIMSKLLQVSCGWVYASDGRIASLDNGSRISALIDAIDGTSNKILVFATFKHATDGISKALIANGYADHAVVTGDTTAKQRNEIFQIFQTTNKYRILVAHPQCLAHGVTLTRADTIVWFNPTTNLEIYDQANRRIRRIGQKNKQLVLHFQGSKVEKRVYKMLMTKQTVQTSFLEMFKEAV